MKDCIDIINKARELCLSDNLEEIEKKFESCTECEECYFCAKPLPIDLPKLCMLYGKEIENNQTGCLGGYKRKR